MKDVEIHAMEKDESVEESYNTKQLASRYRITPKTFRAWLKRSKMDLGIRVGNSFTPKQVKIIFDHLGKPFVWIGSWWGWKLMARMVVGGGDSNEDGHGEDELNDEESLRQ